VPTPTGSRSGRRYSAALFCSLLTALAGCRESPSLPAPTSIESLCLGAPAHATRIFKLPGIDAVRSDRLVRTDDLHVDVDALERVAVSHAREQAAPELDEESVRLYVTDNGGGVLVWWRTKPVTLAYEPVESKRGQVRVQVSAAAVADHGPTSAGRLIYLLERPAESAQPPLWKAFVVQDAERVCT
jgi:hypothetical protein